MLLAEKGTKAKAQTGDLTKTLTQALQHIKDPELKKEVEGIKIRNAAEIHTAENKKSYLVQVSAASEKTIHNAHATIVKTLESKLSSSVVIVPARKRINGNLYRKYKGKKVPRTETLSYVFDAFLQDVVYPAAVVGKKSDSQSQKQGNSKCLLISLIKRLLKERLILLLLPIKL